MILPSEQPVSTVCYIKYILGVCMNDLACLTNYICVVLFYVSLYILKTNDITRWSTFTNNMLYQMYMLGVRMNDLACLVNQCVILPHVSHSENEWFYLLINVCHLYDMYKLEVCMIDFICRFNHKCYPTSPVPIHIEKEWSYPLINFYQRMVYNIYILDAYMIDLTSLVNLKCVILLHMSLYTLKTNDLT